MLLWILLSSWEFLFFLYLIWWWLNVSQVNRLVLGFFQLRPMFKFIILICYMKVVNNKKKINFQFEQKYIVKNLIQFDRIVHRERKNVTIINKKKQRNGAKKKISDNNFLFHKLHAVIVLASAKWFYSHSTCIAFQCFSSSLG